ncbi:MAG: Na+/H+ antiporter NhaC family protein [Negativicutes bacterium]|nr:Na+/H+ antiporter NhaC family protein [Negativicutes bacterium]
MGDWHFYFQLASLSVIVVYAVMVFRNVEPLTATVASVILGFAFNLAGPLEIGKVMEGSIGSFLGLIGFIIMLGRGLGEVLNESRVSHTLVHRIVYGIGINTKTRVKIGVVVSSVVIVAVLGTLAGGLAILAPILRPVAASVGISRPSLAVLMQAAGEEALIIGPFAPPVVALLGVTGISYLTMLTHASLPIAVVTLVTTWLMANRLQRQYSDELFEQETGGQRFVPSRRQLAATGLFVAAFVGCVVYGLALRAKTSYVVFVMLFLALLTGLAGGLGFGRIIGLLLEGMRKNFNLFLIFVFLGPMLDLVQSAGGFTALTELLEPLERMGGTAVLSVIVGVTGAFGMPAASAAVIKMLHEMFSPAALAMQLPVVTFAFSMLLATRITNFAYPGANMFAAMGFAESKNVKAMIRNGLTVAAVQVVFLIVYSILFA